MNRNEVHAKCKEENIYYINNPKFFDKLEKITSRYPNQIGHVLHSKKNADLEQWIISMTKNFINFEKCNLVTRSYWIIHGITKLPKCERDECVCSVGMNSNVNFKQGYAPFCTTSCALKAYNATIKKEYRKNYINRKSPKRPVSSKLDEIDCTNLSKNEIKVLIKTIKRENIEDYCKETNEKALQELHNAPLKQSINLLNLETNVYFKDNKDNFLLLKELVEKFPRSYQRKLNALGTPFERKHNLELRFIFLKKWIESLLPQLKDPFFKMSTKVGWILHGLVDFPTCKTCNRNENYQKINVNPFSMYALHCSVSCGTNDIATKEKINATMMQKYGQHRQSIAEKMLQTKAALQIENPSYKMNQQNKRRETCIIKYGVDCSSKAKEVKEKAKRTNQLKYGVDNYTQSNDFKQKVMSTNIKKYGVKWRVMTEEFKLQYKKTMLRKYGVECCMHCPQIFAKIKSKYFYEDRWFSSAPELAFYIFLKDSGKTFEYQPEVTIKYIFNNEQHQYWPDFLVDGQMIELKGNQFLKEDGTWQNPYDHSLDALYEAKHQCCIANNVKILYYKNYKKYLDYVKDKYGKDYLRQFKKSECK